MILTNMSSLFSDDIDDIVFGINEAKFTVNWYYNADRRTPEMLNELKGDIITICSFWSGKTYVGFPKHPRIKSAFQSFFEDLMRLLLKMKDGDNNEERAFATSLLFRGKVYRYLGSDAPNKKIVKPHYDRIYVSWSKLPENSYLLSKLYGKITWISCEIEYPFYGIDIDALGCSRGNEQEVVFPTIKECVREINYI